VEDVELLVDAVGHAVEVLAGRPLAALTGAGLSTDSGIPDYRGPGSPRRLPMTYQEFLSGPTAQRRYWARSHVGWTRIGAAAPNDGHRALAALERTGPLRGLITQNVDGLHAAAGSRALIDLHGRIADVVCTSCGRRSPRADLQRRLVAANPDFVETAGDAVQAAPDGDAELAATDGFRLVGCLACGGLLKPDVVFFGESVPRERVSAAMAALERADAMLIVGSSLMVYSGFRFAAAMAAAGKPIAAVNLGKTRADELFALKVEERCAGALAFLLDGSHSARKLTNGSTDEARRAGR
jgi:NAD-dependent SIR2 family protein deacetylase